MNPAETLTSSSTSLMDNWPTATAKALRAVGKDILSVEKFKKFFNAYVNRLEHAAIKERLKKRPNYWRKALYKAYTALPDLQMEKATSSPKKLQKHSEELPESASKHTEEVPGLVLEDLNTKLVTDEGAAGAKLIGCMIDFLRCCEDLTEGKKLGADIIDQHLRSFIILAQSRWKAGDDVTYKERSYGQVMSSLLSLLVDLRFNAMSAVPGGVEWLASRILYILERYPDYIPEVVSSCSTLTESHAQLGLYLVQKVARFTFCCAGYTKFMHLCKRLTDCCDRWNIRRADIDKEAMVAIRPAGWLKFVRKHDSDLYELLSVNKARLTWSILNEITTNQLLRLIELEEAHLTEMSEPPVETHEGSQLSSLHGLPIDAETGEPLAQMQEPSASSVDDNPERMYAEDAEISHALDVYLKEQFPSKPTTGFVIDRGACNISEVKLKQRMVDTNSMGVGKHKIKNKTNKTQVLSLDQQFGLPQKSEIRQKSTEHGGSPQFSSVTAGPSQVISTSPIDGTRRKGEKKKKLKRQPCTNQTSEHVRSADESHPQVETKDLTHVSKTDVKPGKRNSGMNCTGNEMREVKKKKARKSLPSDDQPPSRSIKYTRQPYEESNMPDALNVTVEDDLHKVCVIPKETEKQKRKSLSSPDHASGPTISSEENWEPAADNQLPCFSTIKVEPKAGLDSKTETDNVCSEEETGTALTQARKDQTSNGLTKRGNKSCQPEVLSLVVTDDTVPPCAPADSSSAAKPNVQGIFLLTDNANGSIGGSKTAGPHIFTNSKSSDSIWGFGLPDNNFRVHADSAHLFPDMYLPAADVPGPLKDLPSGGSFGLSRICSPDDSAIATVKGRSSSVDETSGTRCELSGVVLHGSKTLKVSKNASSKRTDHTPDEVVMLSDEITVAKQRVIEVSSSSFDSPVKPATSYPTDTESGVVEDRRARHRVSRNASASLGNSRASTSDKPGVCILSSEEPDSDVVEELSIVSTGARMSHKRLLATSNSNALSRPASFNRFGYSENMIVPEKRVIEEPRLSNLATVVTNTSPSTRAGYGDDPVEVFVLSPGLAQGLQDISHSHLVSDVTVALDEGNDIEVVSTPSKPHNQSPSKLTADTFAVSKNNVPPLTVSPSKVVDPLVRPRRIDASSYCRTDENEVGDKPSDLVANAVAALNNDNDIVDITPSKRVIIQKQSPLSAAVCISPAKMSHSVARESQEHGYYNIRLNEPVEQQSEVIAVASPSAECLSTHSENELGGDASVCDMANCHQQLWNTESESTGFVASPNKQLSKKTSSTKHEKEHNLTRKSKSTIVSLEADSLSDEGISVEEVTGPFEKQHEKDSKKVDLSSSMVSKLVQNEEEAVVESAVSTSRKKIKSIKKSAKSGQYVGEVGSPDKLLKESECSLSISSDLSPNVHQSKNQTAQHADVSSPMKSVHVINSDSQQVDTKQLFSPHTDQTEVEHKAVQSKALQPLFKDQRSRKRTSPDIITESEPQARSFSVVKEKEERDHSGKARRVTRRSEAVAVSEADDIVASAAHLKTRKMVQQNKLSGGQSTDTSSSLSDEKVTNATQSVGLPEKSFRKGRLEFNPPEEEIVFSMIVNDESEELIKVIQPTMMYDKSKENGIKPAGNTHNLATSPNTTTVDRSLTQTKLDDHSVEHSLKQDTIAAGSDEFASPSARRYSRDRIQKAACSPTKEAALLPSTQLITVAETMLPTVEYAVIDSKTKGNVGDSGCSPIQQSTKQRIGDCWKSDISHTAAEADHTEVQLTTSTPPRRTRSSVNSSVGNKGRNSTITNIISLRTLNDEPAVHASDRKSANPPKSVEVIDLVSLSSQQTVDAMSQVSVHASRNDISKEVQRDISSSDEKAGDNVRSKRSLSRKQPAVRCSIRRLELPHSGVSNASDVSGEFLMTSSSMEELPSRHSPIRRSKRLSKGGQDHMLAGSSQSEDTSEAESVSRKGTSRARRAKHALEPIVEVQTMDKEINMELESEFGTPSARSAVSDAVSDVGERLDTSESSASTVSYSLRTRRSVRPRDASAAHASNSESSIPTRRSRRVSGSSVESSYSLRK